MSLGTSFPKLVGTLWKVRHTTIFVRHYSLNLAHGVPCQATWHCLAKVWVTFNSQVPGVWKSIPVALSQRVIQFKGTAAMIVAPHFKKQPSIMAVLIPYLKHKTVWTWMISIDSSLILSINPLHFSVQVNLYVPCFLRKKLMILSHGIILSMDPHPLKIWVFTWPLLY